MLDPEPDPHQYADDKWNTSLFEQFFKGSSLYLEARIRIQIRIRVKVKSRIRIRIKVMRIHNTAF